MSWREVHIYLHGQSQMDAFISKDLPLIAADLECERQWFFIRYWLGGPHVRLRVQSPRPNDAIATIVGKAAARREAPQLLSREQFYKYPKFDGKAVDATHLPWFNDGTVNIVKYRPETHYYGTGDDLRRSEALFCRSSQLAAVLSAGVAQADRALLAAELLIGTLAKAKEHGAELFLERYRSFLQPFDEVGHLRERRDWSKLKSQVDRLTLVFTERSRPAQVWKEALETWDAPAEVRPFRLVMLHHLMLNRIGVTPPTEARLLAALTRSPTDATV